MVGAGGRGRGDVLAFSPSDGPDIRIRTRKIKKPTPYSVLEDELRVRLERKRLIGAAGRLQTYMCMYVHKTAKLPVIHSYIYCCTNNKLYKM